jgi:2-dehydropantoate 2-reductase
LTRWSNSDAFPAPFRQVLVYGAGVLGSLYAARLRQTGVDVSLLARGRRLADLREHGIVLESLNTRELTVVRLPFVESLLPDHHYDLVLVLVRKNQVDAILPALAAARGVSVFCFMVNTADGFEKWGKAVGMVRLVLGFPGAGGSRKGLVVRYDVIPAWMQPTTFGEPDGRITPRVAGLLELVRRAGFPVTSSTDMRSWLTSHVALVSPLANAIYLSGGDIHAFSKQNGAVRLAVDAIREGFSVIRRLGMRVALAKLRILEVIPAAMLAALLRAWAGTPHFETMAGAHALAAHDEMLCLAREFYGLVRKSGIPTPMIDEPRNACEAFKPGTGR